MTATIVQIDCMKTARDHSNLWNSPRNQLLRAIGKHTTVYCGGFDGGTVRDERGQCFDWWPTEEKLSGHFRKIKIVEAR